MQHCKTTACLKTSNSSKAYVTRDGNSSAAEKSVYNVQYVQL